MVYKKYIKKDGKLFGPYYYESYRASDGRVKTRYVSEEPAASRRVTLFLVFGALVLLLFASYFLINSPSPKQFSSETSKTSAGITGFAAKFYSFITGLTSDNGNEGGGNGGGGEISSIVEASSESSVSEPASSPAETSEISATSAETPTEEIMPSEEGKTKEDKEKEEKGERTEEKAGEETPAEAPTETPAEEPTPESAVNETIFQIDETIEQPTEPELAVNGSAVPENETQKQRTEPVNETLSSEVIEIPEENITLINGTTIENVSIENATIENITITNETANITTETTLKQYGAVLGKPVKWEKKVKVDIAGEQAATLNGLTIELPALAGNVSVKKIDSLTGEELEFGKAGSEEESGGEADEKEGGETEAIEADIMTGEPAAELAPTQEQTQEPESVEIIPENPMPNEVEPVVDVTITGGVIKKFFGRMFNFFIGITGRAIDIIETPEEVLVEVTEELADEEAVIVEYYTSAPYAEERVLEENKSKEVKIIGPDSVHYENVLAFSELPAAVGNAANIKLYWHADNNGTIEKQEANFSAVDADGDAVFDYIEWVVPGLSEQTYEIEIIVITKALHLNENKSLISDIYERVRERDDAWSEEIPAGHYVRVTFEEALDSTRDITIYARSAWRAGNETNQANVSANIEVYIEGRNESISAIADISSEGTYKTYLTGLPDGESYATFDLRIIGNRVEIDWIVDPTTANIPAISSVTLTTTNVSNNNTNQNLTSTIAYSDADTGDNITLAYNWYRNNALNATTMITSTDASGNGLVSYWSFDNDTMDYWGNNNGTTSGAATTASGKVGGGWQFDGSDDYVDINSSSSLNITSSSQLSISAWVYLDTIGDGDCDWDETGTIVAKGNSQNGLNTYVLAHNKNCGGAGTAAWFSVRNSTGDIRVYVGGNINLVVNRWYYLTGTWNGTTARIYVDGSLDNSSTVGGMRAYSDNCVVSIGRSRFDTCTGAYNAAGQSYVFDGTIDEVQIHNRSLSAAEVYQLYLGGNWSGRTMHSDRTEPGDSWKLGVLAGDFLNWSAETQSSSLTITGPPNTTLVVLNSSTFKNFTNEDLKCYANITDADSANVYANYTWFQNGAEQASPRGQSSAFSAGTVALIATLDAGNTTTYDNWTCSILAYDGLSYEAEWNNSTTLNILAGCGDGSCNNGETCNDCQADCGICGGGGSGPGPGPEQEEQPCTLNCACATSTCIGSTCSNGCGGTCSGSLAPACPAASTIACGTAITSTNACTGCAGTGILCGAAYTCTSGICIRAGECDSDSDCEDSNACTDNACGSDFKCSATFNTASCNDASACTENDICSAGVCAGKQKNCDDNIACTVDSCVAGVCQHASSSCTCTKDSDCNDGNVCTNDACSNGQCSASSNTASCDDANPCTIGERCSGGSCSGGTSKDCSAGKTCEPMTGRCITGEPPNEIPEDVVNIKGIFGLEKECFSDFGCDKWTECAGEYDIYDLVSGVEIKGTKTRLCMDFNNCKSNFVEKEECTFRVPVVIQTKLWCNEEYTEIRNESGSILARLKKGLGEKDASSSFLGIKLNLVGEGHCDYCYDDVQNYDETGVDCGGSCVSCELPGWPLPARMKISVLKYWTLFILSMVLLVLTLAYTIRQIIIAHKAGEFARLFRKFKFWKEEGYDVEVLEPHLQQATQKL